MNNDYQELLHFVSNNTDEVICRNWARDLREKRELVAQAEHLRDTAEHAKGLFKLAANNADDNFHLVVAVDREIDELEMDLSQTPEKPIRDIQADAIEKAADDLCLFRGHLENTVDRDEIKEYAQRVRGGQQ